MRIRCVTNWKELAEVELLIVPSAVSNRSGALSAVSGRLGLDQDRLAARLAAAPDEGLSLVVRDGDRPSEICLLGTGKDWAPAGLRGALRRLLRAYKRRPRNLGVDLSFLDPSQESLPFVQAGVEGCVLGDYDPGLYKGRGPGSGGRPEEREQVQTLTLLLPVALKDAAVRRSARAASVAACQREILDLVNQPGNLLTPERLGEAVSDAGRRDGYRVRVLDKTAIRKEGLEALLAVNQGSALPPVLIVLEHRPEGLPAGAPVVGLVGKGVTFDSGGISIKNAENMSWMKSDMAGAAAVAGTLGAAARLGLPLHLVGVIPATDNKPGGAALNPGDVIGSLAGISIEVEDTDAEGRLLLADGLAYLEKHFSPRVMIDLATLTGACIIALGDKAAGLFTSDDSLARALTSAGERAGERLWRLPLWPEYDRQIESDVADVKNYGGRSGGAVTAARFLQMFVGKDSSWAHLDIAGVAYPESEGSRFRGASGFGVRLLAEYLEELGGDGKRS